MDDDNTCVICRASTTDSALCDSCGRDLDQHDYTEYRCHNCSRTVTVRIEDAGALVEICPECCAKPSSPPYSLSGSSLLDGQNICNSINCNNMLGIGTSRIIDKNICEECWEHRHDDAYDESKSRVCGLCKK